MSKNKNLTNSTIRGIVCRQGGFVCPMSEVAPNDLGFFATGLTLEWVQPSQRVQPLQRTQLLQRVQIC